MHFDALAGNDVERLDRAISICRDLVLHLHSFEDEQDIASLDSLAFGSDELHNLAQRLLRQLPLPEQPSEPELLSEPEPLSVQPSEQQLLPSLLRLRLHKRCH